MKRSTAVGLGIGTVVVVLGAIYALRSHEGGGKEDHSAPSSATDTSRPERHRRGGDNGGPQGADAPVLVDDDPVGALRLEGQVVGEDDKPVGGAVVVLSANPPKSTKSEADGSFAFDGLVARPYTLVARAKAGVAGPVTARLTAKSEPVILHLRAAGAVEVTVVDPKHQAVTGATVELRGADTQSGETEAGGTARFRPVVPGGYDVVASAPGFARAHARVRIGEDEAKVTLQLAHGARVAGKVVDDKGAPVAGAQVVFAGASDWSTRGDERLDGVATGTDGRFQFAAIAAGSWRFVARHPEHAPGTSAIVTVDGETPRDGIEIKLPPGATVRGRVVDQASAPVPGARVRVGLAARDRMIGEGPRQVYSDAHGEFIVRGLPRAPLMAIAMGDDAASDAQKLDATGGDVNDVVLKLDVTGTIAGTVVDEGGTELEGIQVSASPDMRSVMRGGGGGDISQWRLRGFPEDLTDASGHFTLTGLEPGTYRVRATRAKHAARGRGMAGEGTQAETGTKDLRIVLPPEGTVKGRVAMADGSPPGPFTVQVGGMSEMVSSSDGSFTVDGLLPEHYTVNVRGNQFVPASAEADVKGGAVVDVGTITVEKGRMIGGVVTAQGQPVANATVYAGRQIIGTGSTSNAQLGGGGGGAGFGQGTRTATTGDDGTFSMSGFGQGDVTLLAERDDLGRSLPQQLVYGNPNENNLTLDLQPFGALHGTLTTGSQPASGIIVTSQSTTASQAIYTVATGPDGTYRFDKLAPDTYKVSATLGMPMRGMKFYSKTATVASGQDVALDLQYDPGAVTLDVIGVPAPGQKTSSAVMYILSGSIHPATHRELLQALANQGEGTSQFIPVPFGMKTQFTELDPGAYTVCAVALPAEVHGRGAAFQYFQTYGDALPVTCAPVVVTASPTEQTTNLPIVVPPYQGGSAGSGSGSGSGSSSGAGSGSGAGSARGSGS